MHEGGTYLHFTSRGGFVRLSGRFRSTIVRNCTDPRFSVRALRDLPTILKPPASWYVNAYHRLRLCP
jgi:hypothetical protein